MSDRDSKPVHDSISRHLADTTGLTIFSSSSTEHTKPTSKALASLTNTYLGASELASRFDLGVLKRISLETNGGISIRQNFIKPSTECSKQNGDGAQGRMPDREDVSRLASEDDGQSPPALIATVVASSSASDAQDLQLVERELEAMGVAFQTAWVAGSVSKGDSGSELTGKV